MLYTCDERLVWGTSKPIVLVILQGEFASHVG